MANGLALQKKVSNLLRSMNATQKTWYFRQHTTQGGSPLLGIGGATAWYDTVMDPQPAEQQLAVEEIATSGGLYAMGDYQLTVSGEIDEELLRTSMLVRGVDTCRIVRYEPAVLGGVVAVWIVIARIAKVTS